MINWKVRLRNPLFWATMVPAVTACAYTVMALLDIVPAVSESTLISGLSAVISALTMLGVLIDPTTKGVEDSQQALGYEEPK